MTDRADGRRWTRIVGLVVSVIVMVVMAGCGVDASAVPEDAGDGLGADPQSASGVAPPRPNQFSVPVDLVLGFLKATAGAGETAVQQVRAFLNGAGRKTWTAPEAQNDLTVIRVVAKRTEATQGGRTPVVVDYQVVGTLTERGRLTKLLDPAAKPRQMKFWVAPQPEALTQLRIDEIEDAPEGLLISDDGLIEYYSIQPIYFWDDAYSSLVPDLRYIVKGLSPATQANLVVQWIVEGPSPMLGGVQRLRSGATKEGVVTDDKGVLSIELNPLAAPDDKAITRLLYQLQWSLRGNGSSAPALSLKIGDIVRTAGISDTAYLPFNVAHLLPTDPQAFDIVAERVVALPTRPDGARPTVVLLDARENRGVVAAAVNRTLDRAALVVRRYDGTFALQILRRDEASQPAPRLVQAEMGRPAWVPGSQVVLVTAAGRIRWVNAMTGALGELPLRNVGDVTGVSVSPDGRRIAFVADRRLYVAQLGVGEGKVTVEEPQLLSITGSLAVVAVAWASAEWLNLVGTVGSAAVLYEVTADGVIARRKDLSTGIEPSDIVAYPTAGFAASGDVYVLTPSGAYVQGTSESNLRAPFFAS
jgi:hypothetical protein